MAFPSHPGCPIMENSRNRRHSELMSFFQVFFPLLQLRFSSCTCCVACIRAFIKRRWKGTRDGSDSFLPHWAFITSACRESSKHPSAKVGWGVMQDHFWSGYDGGYPNNTSALEMQSIPPYLTMYVPLVSRQFNPCSDPGAITGILLTAQWLCWWHFLDIT